MAAGLGGVLPSAAVAMAAGSHRLKRRRSLSSTLGAILCYDQVRSSIMISSSDCWMALIYRSAARRGTQRRQPSEEDGASDFGAPTVYYSSVHAVHLAIRRFMESCAVAVWMM
ncbi:hypothetical protein ACLOJK_013268 [Asimina triloba]